MSCDEGLLILCCCGKPLCLRQQPALPCLPQGKGLSLYMLETSTFERWTNAIACFMVSLSQGGPQL